MYVENEGAVMRHPGYLTGRYYSTAPNQTSGPSAVAATDTLYLYPFQVFSPITITSLMIRVGTGGAGSSVKTGIWANNPATNKPVGAPLIVDNTGAATTSSSTNVAITATGALQPGFYWAGTKFTGTLPTVICIAAANSYMSWLMGLDTATSSSALTVSAFSMSSTYSNDMPTIASNQSFTINGSNGVAVVALGT